MLSGPATWRDLGRIARLYRAQSPESRRFYHPFPFDRIRLAGLLASIVVLQSGRRRTVRRLPSVAPLLWVVRDSGGRRVLGFGTATFHRDPAGVLVVRTGLFVAPEARRRGVGRLLKQALLREAVGLGARRAEALLIAGNEASWQLNRDLGYRFGSTTFRDRRAPNAELRLAELELVDPLELGGFPVDPRHGGDGTAAGTAAQS